MVLPPSDKWLQWAERIDALRVIPRFLTISYGILYWVLAFKVLEWAVTYPYNDLEDPMVALAIVGLPAAVIPLVGGVVVNMTKDYWKGGRRWNGHQGDTPNVELDS